MPNKEKEKLILHLIKIETVLARLYSGFSTRNNFTVPVKKFWTTIAKEEELHGNILNKIHQAIKDDKTTVTLDIQIESLKKFIAKVNELFRKASSEDLEESEAYSIGATIEMELDESGFTKMIQTSDEKLNRLLKMVENDTKKHRVMLINYSRGVR